MFRALDMLHARNPIGILVHGACPTGADKWADEWAAERNVEREPWPADWKRLGPAGGPVRNHLMANMGAAGLVAFPGGNGTVNMIREAKRANIQVWRPVPERKSDAAVQNVAEARDSNNQEAN